MLLDESSPRHAHPPNTNITLKPHQLAILENARAQEASSPPPPICIMADPPGSGKTYALLALMQEYTQPNETNILIVPQNIYTQWIDSIKAWSPRLTYKSYMNYSEITSLYFNPRIDNPSTILITTPVYFGIISDSLAAAKVAVRRVIIDEIDSVASMLQKRISCKTLWMVSASFTPECLLNTPYMVATAPSSENQNQNQNHPPFQITKCTPDFVASGFPLPPMIRSDIICQNFYIGLLEGLLPQTSMLKINALDFSFNNPKIVTAKNVLEYFVADLRASIAAGEAKITASEKSIKDCIWQRDLYIGTASYIASLQTPDLRTILAECPPLQKQGLLLILDRYGYTDPAKAPPTINLYEFKEFASKLTNNSGLESLREELNKTKDTLASNTKTYDNICERLNNADTCLICYEPFGPGSERVVSQCCKQTFCKQCIADWMVNKTDCPCPMCRHQLRLVMESAPQQPAPASSLEEIPEPAPAPAQAQAPAPQTINPSDKMTVMNNLFDDNILGPKVIIFNNYPAVFLEIKKNLDARNILWTELDGGNIAAIDRNLAQYKAGTTRVLLTNSSFYGCGINLENTSDIVIMHKCNAQRMTSDGMEQQIIGRAQRPGRTGPLNVWTLLHQNEAPPTNLIRPMGPAPARAPVPPATPDVAPAPSLYGSWLTASPFTNQQASTSSISSTSAISTSPVPSEYLPPSPHQLTHDLDQMVLARQEIWRT